jgi:hypothetical protein
MNNSKLEETIRAMIRKIIQENSETLEASKASKKNIVKKKNDQDGDGDADFADVMISRMVASGMPKKQAIKKTRKHDT